MNGKEPDGRETRHICSLQVLHYGIFCLHLQHVLKMSLMMNTVVRCLCLLVLACCGTVAVRADLSLTETSAREVAMAFWQRKGGVAKRGYGATGVGDAMQLLYAVRSGYVFVPSGGKGFVWVAGSAGQPVVAGYSLTSDVREAACPAVLSGWMNASGPLSGGERSSVPVPPLLTSVWHQDAPYNGLCPYYRDDDGEVSDVPCKVGCVATATSEVMRYYAWPDVLQDTLHGWSTEHYTLPDVMPGTQIDWANMLDSYDGIYTDAEARAVQELALYCGMACHMNYGEYASGSNVVDLLLPLRHVFGYEYVRLYDRSRYSPDRWMELLQYELRRGVPLVYQGYNMAFVGHAFVLDGMDEDGFFHIRWGECGGFYDGYFNVDILNVLENPDDPTGMGRELGYFCNQCALAFHPESLPDFPGDTLTYDSEDVAVDRLAFSHAPDTRFYATADVTLTNHSADTITYTLLLFTAEQAGEVDWDSVTNVGITALTLYPGRTETVPVRCYFRQSGRLYLGATGDMEHVLYLEPVEVEGARNTYLSVKAVEPLVLDSRHGVFRVEMDNTGTAGWVNNLLTYDLIQEGMERGYSHWSLLNIPPGEAICDTVTFGGLQPGADYTLHIRPAGGDSYAYDFHVPGADGVAEIQADVQTGAHAIYTLQGHQVGSVPADEVRRTLYSLPKGIYVIVTPDGSSRKFENH